MLVGREKEIHLLHAIQNDDSSHFIVAQLSRQKSEIFIMN